jgi:ABC-type antimicrobial peptide transport system permease subunit
MIWTQQESSQPVAPLMAELVARRAQAMAKDDIPAIVDTAAAQTLHLSVGTPFSLGNYQGQVNFVTIAVVNRIPTISDTTESSGTSDTILAGGILVDYASYAAVVAATLQVDIGGTTNIWLRTKDDAASLANVREALNYGDLQLAALNDRRALIESLSSDPFYLALFGLLFIGAATALILALVGNLTASWLSARSRLTNFAVMRALGGTPYQIARILTVEQGFVYAAALALGIMLGLLLSFLVLPNFIFTTAVATNQLTTAEFYVLQNVPPIQVIVSPGLLFVALGVLVVICCVALIMMARVVLWPSISQTLRLNED